MISIIILNYNSADDTEACIRSLYAQCSDREAFEILIVDNASPEPGINAVPERLGFPPHLRLIHAPKNSGYGAGNNLGMKHAKGDLFLILNPDVRVLSDPLPILQRFFAETPDAGVAGAMLQDEAGQFQLSFGTFTDTERELRWDFLVTAFWRKWHFAALREKILSSPAPVEADWVLGAFFALRRQAFEESGGFDEGYFLYYEENDWCRTLRSSGWKVFVLPTLKALHYGSKTTQRNYEFYYTQLYLSKLRYIHKHFRGLTRGTMQLISLCGAIVRWGLSFFTAPTMQLRQKRRGYQVALRLHLVSPKNSTSHRIQ